MSEFFGLLITGIMNGSIYSMIALGFILLYKCSGVLNLAQGELVIIGAYIFYAISIQLGLPVWVGFLGTFVFSVCLGLLIERVALRPLLGQPMLALAIATLALGGLLQGIMMLIWGSGVFSLPRLFPIGGVSLAGVVISYEIIFFFVISASIVAILLLFFRYSKLGVEMMATSEDNRVARSLGINVKRILALSWVISALVAATGGILMTSVIGVHYSATGIGLRAISVVLLGGLESFGGVIVAGPLVGAVEFIAAGYIDPLIGGGFREIAGFIMMLIVLFFRPYGFFGWQKIERV